MKNNYFSDLIKLIAIYYSGETMKKLFEILGIIALLGWLVEWLCADVGRYMLGLGIFIYILYRMFKSEFGE